MKKAQERPQVNFRPSAGLKKRLQGAADTNGVPLNAEIIRRLEQSFVNEVLGNMIETTATRVAIEVSVQLKDQMMSYVNATLVANELYEKRKRDEEAREEKANG